MTILVRKLWLTVAAGVATSLLCGGVIMDAFSHSLWGLEFFRGSEARRRAVAERAIEPHGPGPRNAASVGDLAMTDASSSGTFGQFDKIIVDVEFDGSIRVFGESMEMAKFRAMLSDQLTNHAKTMVTIRPDDDCVFRHIEQVIQVCDDCKIHHQTIASAESIKPPEAVTRKKTG